MIAEYFGWDGFGVFIECLATVISLADDWLVLYGIWRPFGYLLSVTQLTFLALLFTEQTFWPSAFLKL